MRISDWSSDVCSSDLFLPLDFTLSTSALYELIEWGAAMLFGGDLGMQYLGTQGDIWDAHKDMGLAALGALIAMLAAAAINGSEERRGGNEWVGQGCSRGSP